MAVEKTAKAEGKYQVIKAKYKEIAPKVNLKISHEFGSLGFHMAALDMKVVYLNMVNFETLYLRAKEISWIGQLAKYSMAHLSKM